LSLEKLCVVKKILNKPGAYDYYIAADLVDQILYNCHTACDGYEVDCPYMTPSEYNRSSYKPVSDV